MSKRPPRIFGTSEIAIAKAESGVGFRFPPSYRKWLLENNGRALEGLGERPFPVFDDRDPRSTWDSIARNFANGWARWRENFEGEPVAERFPALLPFADTGGGDCYCF